MKLAEVDVWNDSRGIELAADAIVWGLEKGEISPISVAHYAGDIARFELLTGNGPARVVQQSPVSVEATAARLEAVRLAAETMQPTMEQS